MRAYGRLLLLLACLLAGAPVARAGDEALCEGEIRAVEARERLPAGLLRALAVSEAGRRDPGTGAVAPWPWTVDHAGDGRYFATAAEAIAWVEELRRAGRRNIDVGCVQVNLMHHPAAFADLRQALDPAANVAYGARLLAALRRAAGSWERAVELYHSATPGLGGPYRARVYAAWAAAGGAAVAAGAGPDAPPAGSGGGDPGPAGAAEPAPAVLARSNLSTWPALPGDDRR